MHKKYKRMLQGMQDKKAFRNKGTKKGQWFLYILECSNGAFYTGITKNITRRIKMHNEGKGSRYTRIWRPVKLLYKETCMGRAEALVREYKIKSFSRKQKEALINNF